MFDYKEMEKKLHTELLSGNIDIISYHLMCKGIEDLKAQVSTHTYTDLNMAYVPNMK